MRTLWKYLMVSAGLFLFQLIYHHFGHGVVSNVLRYTWILPLMGGLLWFFQRRFFAKSAKRLEFNLLNSSIAAFCVRNILYGILEIAGSDSPYLIFLTAAGSFFAAAWLVASLREFRQLRLV